MTFEFEFFNGDTNLIKFDSFVKQFGLTTENKEFLNFLKSEYCKEIFQNNNRIIHIETGNISYNDRDTNESIFQFIQNQQNTSKGIIKHDFKFSANLKQYYKWILNEFDAQDKTSYDISTFKNVKFLVYRYNDFLASGGNELIKIRHSQVTDDCLAAEEIQNQDWQYLIECILEVSNDPDKIQSKEKFLQNTIENVTIGKKIYKMMFNAVATNFNLMIQDLSHDKIKNILEDFFLKNYSYLQSLTNLHDWISFYYSFGRFPGLNDFIHLPYHKKRYFLKTTKNLSPTNLYKKFISSDTLGLTSFHALCALNIYLGRNKDISAVAYGKFSKNMTYQALSEENDSVFLSFDESINLTHSIVNTLVDITREENNAITEISDKVNKKLDFTFDAKEEVPAITETPIKLPSEPIQTSTPLTETEINSLYDQEKNNYLKSSLQINSVDVESAVERADIENEKLFQEIIDPTPGLIVDNKIDVDKVNSKDESSEDFIFSDSLKARLSQTIEKARQKINSISFTSPAIEDIPNNTIYPKEEIKAEDIYIDDSLKDLARLIYFPQPSTDNGEDFKVDVVKNEMILFKSPSLTIVSIYKEDLNNILQNIIDDLDLNLKDMLMSPKDTQDTKQKKVILISSLKN